MRELWVSEGIVRMRELLVSEGIMRMRELWEWVIERIMSKWENLVSERMREFCKWENYENE